MSKNPITLRISEDTRSKLKTVAKEKKRTVNNLMVCIIEEYIVDEYIKMTKSPRKIDIDIKPTFK